MEFKKDLLTLCITLSLRLVFKETYLLGTSLVKMWYDIGKKFCIGSTFSKGSQLKIISYHFHKFFSCSREE